MKTFLEFCSEDKNENFDWVLEMFGVRRPSMGGGGGIEMLRQKFGSAPYRVDDHLIELLGNSAPGSMTRRQAMDAIKQRHGHQVAAWMEKFLDSGGKFDPESERTANLGNDDRGTWY